MPCCCICFSSERVSIFKEVREAFREFYISNEGGLLDLSDVHSILTTIEQKESSREESTVRNNVQENDGHWFTPENNKQSLKNSTFHDTPIGLDDPDDLTLGARVEGEAYLSELGFDFGHENVYNPVDVDTFGESNELNETENASETAIVNTNPSFQQRIDQQATQQQHNEHQQAEQQTEKQQDDKQQEDKQQPDKQQPDKQQVDNKQQADDNNKKKDSKLTGSKHQLTDDNNNENDNELTSNIHQLTDDNKNKNNKHSSNSKNTTNKVSPERNADTDSSDNNQAPKTRTTNKTKYLCKNGCQTIVTTDNPAFCKAPHRLSNAVCHGCGVAITSAVMKAAGEIHFCNMLGVYEKGVLACSFVMCGKCQMEKNEKTEGKHRSRRASRAP